MVKYKFYIPLHISCALGEICVTTLHKVIYSVVMSNGRSGRYMCRFYTKNGKASVWACKLRGAYVWAPLHICKLMRIKNSESKLHLYHFSYNLYLLQFHIRQNCEIQMHYLPVATYMMVLVVLPLSVPEF